MRNSVAAIATLMVAALPGASGCRPEQQAARQPAAVPAAAVPGAVPVERAVRDEEVARHWRAVELTVREKKPGGAVRNIVVPLGGEMAVADTGVVIKVLGFVPDFAMGAETITTKSMSDGNPAAKLQVMDGGREIFRGWTFRDFPDMHSLENPNYAIVLARAVPAGR